VIKRVLWGLVGVVYGIGHFYWTILITGGGHCCFFPFFLFATSLFMGLLYPPLAVFACDLRERWARFGLFTMAVVHIGGLGLISFSVILESLSMIDGQGTPRIGSELVDSWRSNPENIVIGLLPQIISFVVIFLAVGIAVRRETALSRDWTG
jgi:hypothetical protein